MPSPGEVPLCRYQSRHPPQWGFTEACFTFQTSTEKVYLRWPAGYTAAIKSLPQDAAGNFALEGTARGDRPVVLNDWGVVYAYDGSTWRNMCVDTPPIYG